MAILFKEYLLSDGLPIPSSTACEREQRYRSTVTFWDSCQEVSLAGADHASERKGKHESGVVSRARFQKICNLWLRNLCFIG